MREANRLLAGFHTFLDQSLSVSSMHSPQSGSFPRLLIIAEFPPNSGGGGAALARQLLKDYPSEQIYWWSCRPELRGSLGQRVKQHFYCPVPPKLYPHRKFTRLDRKSTRLNS